MILGLSVDKNKFLKLKITVKISINNPIRVLRKIKK
jgi:hypothetical protein